MKFLGVNIEEYETNILKGHNCDFEVKKKIKPKYHLFFSDQEEKFEYILFVKYGICSSGWTNATWGKIKMKKIEEFPNFEFKPNEKFSTKVQFDITEDQIYCGWFSYSRFGGDEWYPSGAVGIFNQNPPKSQRRFHFRMKKFLDYLPYIFGDFKDLELVKLDSFKLMIFKL